MAAYPKFRNMRKNMIVTFISLLFLSVNLFAQRNGDVLSFQGLDEPNDINPKALALGGAFTAASGELGSIFYNPAGLAKISKLQISVSAAYSSRLWRDNQIWLAGGSYKMLPQYMENLYTPPAEFNGIWSDSLGSPFGLSWDPSQVRNPVIGVDPYSKEAADAENSINKFAFSQIAIAFPFQISELKFTAAAALNLNYNPVDYDWNGDHLDPHWGTSFDFSQLAPKDSIVRANWDIYTRERSNGIKNLKGALAFEFTKNIQIGVGFTSMFGSTDDNITLNRIGYFQFVQTGDIWSFSYENRKAVRSGTSTFSSFMFNVGGIIAFRNLDIGFNVDMPYTITRDWDYTDVVANNAGTISTKASGTDKMKVPLCFNIGLKFMPLKNFSIYADLASKPYSKNEFESTAALDTANTPVWTNQYTFAGGLEYRFNEDLTLMAGYRNRTATFVGYGNAVRNQGAPVDSYTLGASYVLPVGQVTIAYEYRKLKYYDVYFTSRNYTLVSTDNIILGYTFSF
jgi:long-subunit fatty acid transport protein